MIIDISVFRAFLEGDERSQTIFEKYDEGGLSIVTPTLIDIVKLLPDKQSLRQIEIFLTSANTTTITISEDIDTQALEIMKNHHVTPSISPSQVYTAATAIIQNKPLITFEEQVYGSIEGLIIVRE